MFQVHSDLAGRFRKRMDPHKSGLQIGIIRQTNRISLFTKMLKKQLYLMNSMLLSLEKKLKVIPALVRIKG